ncbi:proteasome regulatory complex component with a PINT domain at the C-terminus [Cryptosporidium bovis]|uniref:proteasome regulatory complex component with a PINT domain at the C-terminus n=1 Tax=Cryptosporidium bovis TaxID=310047 RepID=UPI00351A11BA|nr:proteasome regulatory complex component with a PINT domain at the C-terminus [Cryptosporidium bovis]
MRLVFTSHGGSRSTSIILCDWLFAILNYLDKSKSEEFYSNVCKLIKEEDETDLLEVFLLLMNNVDGVFEILRVVDENKEIILREDVKRKYSELYKESEEFFISLLSILVNPKLNSKRSKECRDLFLNKVISDESIPRLRISILKTYYDTFDQDYDLLIKILKYIYDHDNLSTLEVYFTLFENIERKVLSNFDNNNIDVKYKRDIYISLFNIANKCDNNNYLNKKSYDYLRLYIETFNTIEDIKKGDGNNDLVEYGIRFIVSSIIIQDILFFDSIVSLPIVNYIRDVQGNNVEIKTLFKLLDICLHGKISDYYDNIQNTSEYKKLIDRYKDIGDNESNIICKLQLLTISTLTRDKESINLEELQNEFRLSSFDTQDIVVHAISIGLISGFISENSDTLHINCTTKREFGDNEWDMLNNKISNWISHLNNLSSLIVSSNSSNNNNSGNSINTATNGTN